jgi:hypothetical protein
MFEFQSIARDLVIADKGGALFLLDLQEEPGIPNAIYQYSSIFI